MKLVPCPPKTFGHFYEGDSYLILYVSIATKIPQSSAVINLVYILVSLASKQRSRGMTVLNEHVIFRLTRPAITSPTTFIIGWVRTPLKMSREQRQYTQPRWMITLGAWPCNIARPRAMRVQLFKDTSKMALCKPPL